MSGRTRTIVRWSKQLHCTIVDGPNQTWPWSVAVPRVRLPCNSTASLEKICAWFPELTLQSARRRFRTTLEIEAARSAGAPDELPAFWEDRLYANGERGVDPDPIGVTKDAVRFRIGEVAFEGSNPCARCTVPSRDPKTGAAIEGFQKRFSELRGAELPPWAPNSRFDHFYRFAVNTRVPPSEAGKILRLGDPFTIYIS